MAAELVARAGEVDRLRTDLEAVQAESQNLRSEVAQLSKTADETQKRLDAEVGTFKPMRAQGMCVTLRSCEETIHSFTSAVRPYFSPAHALAVCMPMSISVPCCGLLGNVWHCLCMQWPWGCSQHTSLYVVSGILRIEGHFTCTGQCIASCLISFGIASQC